MQPDGGNKLKIELRLDNIRDLECALGMEANSVGLGDEGCAYRIPSASDIRSAFTSIIESGKRPRLITPRTAENQFDKVKKAVEAAAGFGSMADLIVNDLGVLKLCRDLSSGAGIYIGRLVSRSITDCPWYDMVLKGENQSVGNTLLRHGFDHGEKFIMLHEFGIEGIEVNNISSIGESIKRISQNGFKVFIHMGRRFLTAGRNCTTARYLGRKEGKCLPFCGTTFNLEWEGVWINPTDNNVPAGNEHKSRLKGMVAKGNRVLGPCMNSIEEAVNCEAAAVIIDKEESWDEVKKRIDLIKNIISCKENAGN
jgi:hypothetical protein